LAGEPAAADSTLTELERAVSAAVNRHRAERGLAPLAWSDEAADLARAHSREMAAGRIGFGHDGFEARRRALESKLGPSEVAENVWHESGRGGSVVDAALARWLASPAHRGNLEGPYQRTGVGASRAEDGSIYLTQIFVGSRPPRGGPGR
jgi:uncharacterized protein YkwD